MKPAVDPSWIRLVVRDTRLFVRIFKAVRVVIGQHSRSKMMLLPVNGVVHLSWRLEVYFPFHRAPKHVGRLFTQEVSQVSSPDQESNLDPRTS